MEVNFYFGPDKVPFGLDEKGIVEVGDPAIPFHGIISRGLLNANAASEQTGALWLKYAPLVFDENAYLADPNLEQLRREVKAAEVLSFGQSAMVAKTYVEKHFLPKNPAENSASVELWNIKEGHTSSVWRVSVAGNEVTESFVINVARDRAASAELSETSEKLRTIGQRLPHLPMAKVLDIDSIDSQFLSFPVVVTRNEWVENAFEIHSRKNGHADKAELLLVERFLTDENDPTIITSVLGRRFTAAETDKIYEQIDNFLTNAATCLNEKLSLNINDGDVVWDGKKGVVVAIS